MYEREIDGSKGIFRASTLNESLDMRESFEMTFSASHGSNGGLGAPSRTYSSSDRSKSFEWSILYDKLE